MLSLGGTTGVMPHIKDWGFRACRNEKPQPQVLVALSACPDLKVNSAVCRSSLSAWCLRNLV